MSKPKSKIGVDKPDVKTGNKVEPMTKAPPTPEHPKVEKKKL
jgi:hypothetical protein